MGQHTSKVHAKNVAVVAEHEAKLTKETFMTLGSDENLYFSRLPPDLLRIVFEYKLAVRRDHCALKIFIKFYSKQIIEVNGFRYDLHAPSGALPLRFIICGPLDLAYNR